MGRKKKSEIEFEARKKLLRQVVRGVSEEERLFAILIVCGYSCASAYRISHPDSRASVASSAVLGSRYIEERGVQEALREILDNYWGGWLYLRETGYKGKIKNRSPYCFPKIKYNCLDPHS